MPEGRGPALEIKRPFNGFDINSGGQAAIPLKNQVAIIYSDALSETFEHSIEISADAQFYHLAGGRAPQEIRQPGSVRRTNHFRLGEKADLLCQAELFGVNDCPTAFSEKFQKILLVGDGTELGHPAKIEAARRIITGVSIRQE